MITNFKKISCLCDNPLKDFKDFKKLFLLILKNFVIKYANFTLFYLLQAEDIYFEYFKFNRIIFNKF